MEIIKRMMQTENKLAEMKKEADKIKEDITELKAK